MMRIAIVFLTLLLPVRSAVMAQTDGPVPLEASLATTEEWVDRTEAIRIELSRALEPGEGRLAILLGVTDLTDLFLLSGRTLTYRPEVVPLPGGREELVVYLVAEGVWNEVARLELKVRSRGGFEDRSADYGIDIQGNSRFDTGGDPAEEVPPTEESATAQLNGQAAATRSGWKIEGRASIFGVSEIEEALRFGEEGADADRFDLSEYAVRVSKGRRFLELGHVSYGEHRHLMSAFSSRGVVLGSNLGDRTTVQFAAMNGSSIVGWSNFLGLSRSEHQVLGGGVGVELIGSRPGALRLDLSYLDGSLLPLNDFNQGAINDAEENQGWGARLAGGTGGQRFAFRAGYARSEFRNPQDPLLSQGVDLVPVNAEERDARYLDVDFDLVRNASLGDEWTADVRLALRHERIDPQYRSVGAFVQSDRESNGADVTATLGPVSIQGGHSFSEDNLDEIESILQTETRISRFNLAVPFALAFPDIQSPWLPAFSYGVQRTTQEAGNQPIDSGFNATSHLPDQVSINHNAGLDWQSNRWTLGLSWNFSDQDNRQPGRELDDFQNTGYGVRFSLAPHQRVDLGLQLSRDRAESLADDRTEINDQIGLDVLWRPMDAMSLTGRWSISEFEDEPRTSTSESTVLDLEWNYRIAWREDRRHGGSLQWFLRYAAQDFESEDQTFVFRVVRDQWSLRAGVNLSFR